MVNSNVLWNKMLITGKLKTIKYKNGNLSLGIKTKSLEYGRR